MTAHGVTVVEAVRQTLADLMEQDERVVVLGEDVAALGGVFRATDGLLERFGPTRVIDTPMIELSIVGIGIGMALRGLRPIVEIQFADFIYAAMDQIVNEAARIRYRTAGEWSVPLVIRAPWGSGIHGALYHSQSIEASFSHFTGLKVVAPSTPADVAGLLRAALADPDPVLFLEHKLTYRRVRGELPTRAEVIPIGLLRVARRGRDVTIAAYGWMLHESLAAAELLTDVGIEAEVLDLRTLLPLDVDGVAASVARTGRLAIVHEDMRTMGLGAEIAALIQERCWESLRAPVARITMPDVPGTPFADTLESALIPTAIGIAAAVRDVVRPRERMQELPVDALVGAQPTERRHVALMAGARTTSEDALPRTTAALVDAIASDDKLARQVDPSSVLIDDGTTTVLLREAVLLAPRGIAQRLAACGPASADEAVPLRVVARDVDRAFDAGALRDHDSIALFLQAPDGSSSIRLALLADEAAIDPAAAAALLESVCAKLEARAS